MEWARTVEDVLARRTRALLLDARASMEIAPRVAELMAGELGRDQAWQQAQVNHYCELAEGIFRTESFRGEVIEQRMGLLQRQNAIGK